MHQEQSARSNSDCPWQCPCSASAGASVRVRLSSSLDTCHLSIEVSPVTCLWRTTECPLSPASPHPCSVILSPSPHPATLLSRPAYQNTSASLWTYCTVQLSGNRLHHHQLEMLNVATQPNKTRNMWGKCQVLCKTKLQVIYLSLLNKHQTKIHEK